jgi:hypothetical protein
MIGFAVVAYSHVPYLRAVNTSYETDRSSLLEKGVAGNSLKYIFGLATVSDLTLVFLNAVLLNYGFYRLTDSELGYEAVLLLVLLFMRIGIFIFNLVFTLAGLVYIPLFYLLVVRG